MKVVLSKHDEIGNRLFLGVDGEYYYTKSSTLIKYFTTRAEARRYNDHNKLNSKPYIIWD